MEEKIGIIGTGYVGLVGGVCLAELGHHVIGMDIDEDRVDTLNKGMVPIYEDGLEELLEKNLAARRISFTTDTGMVVDSCDVLFISVGTPPAEDGSADLDNVLAAARSIGKKMASYKVVVVKSTVPVGTCHRVAQVIGEELARRKKAYEFAVVSNPEFLREGSAVRDFMKPYRIVIGTESERARIVMMEVYREFIWLQIPVIFTSIETSEMIKYASNAFLATKISFINELALLCDRTGANVQEVAQGMGLDQRIGADFLRPGPGYGGSCFPKDSRALVKLAEEQGVSLEVVQAVIRANEKQKAAMVEKIQNRLGELSGLTLAMLGLSFKPGTDDLRESPALAIIVRLVNQGARVRAFDPAGYEEAVCRLEEYSKAITYCQDAYHACEKADALLLLTGWDEFQNLDLIQIRKLLKEPLIFDLRNFFSREEVRAAGLEHIGIGVPALQVPGGIERAWPEVASSEEK